jgi:hypothetical protein
VKTYKAYLVAFGLMLSGIAIVYQPIGIVKYVVAPLVIAGIVLALATRSKEQKTISPTKPT